MEVALKEKKGQKKGNNPLPFPWLAGAGHELENIYDEPTFNTLSECKKGSVATLKFPLKNLTMILKVTEVDS